MLDEWPSTTLYKGVAVACSALVSRCYALSPLRSPGPVSGVCSQYAYGVAVKLPEWPRALLSGHHGC